MKSEQTRLVKWLESVVTAVILLVLVQTFLDDFAIIAGWGEESQRILLFTGLFFDIFFTIEFLLRFYNALAVGKGSHYFMHERGWIDFLASVPLLILSSGPSVLALLLDSSVSVGMGGIFNMLKLIKAIRVARILRLLRVIKIFKNIKYADSVMAQRHLAKIITICITGIVLSLFAYSFVTDWIDGVGPDSEIDSREQRIAETLAEEKPTPAVLEGIHVLEKEILLVKWNGESIYSRFDSDNFRDNLMPGDFSLRSEGKVEVYFDRVAVNKFISRNMSWQTIFFFGMILLLLLAYLLLYSPHFALTVSDPIHVMKRGLSEKDYNLEVRVPDRFQTDDIFETASLYNEVYLPLKDRNRETEATTELDLKVDDLKDLF